MLCHKITGYETPLLKALKIDVFKKEKKRKKLAKCCIVPSA